MKSSLVVGLEKDYAKEVEGSFKGSSVLRKRLKELLEQKVKSSNRSSRQESGYDKPCWAYKQADARGFERALQEAISLLED